MRELIFRMPWYKPDGTFSHFSYWGRIYHKNEPNESSFASPGYCGFANPVDDEQFTGFLDSEKTKIFEGDILTQSTEHIVYRKYMVIWQNGAWMCIELKYGIIVYLNELRLENWKVIGNRHDNKELLNGV